MLIYLVIEMFVTEDEELEVEPGVVVPAEELFSIVIPLEVAVWLDWFVTDTQ
jgi:hypothetical protein